MRVIAALTALLFIASSYAIEAINHDEFIQKATQELTEESLKLEATLDARLPVKSKATVGEVIKHKITLNEFSNPIFIIGDDDISREWLKKHAQEIENLGALGFITNISNTKHLDEIQALTKAPILPADVNDLLALLNENHYPFIYKDGVVYQ